METYTISLLAPGFDGVLTSENEFKAYRDARVFMDPATAIETAEDHIADILENAYFTGGKRKIVIHAFESETDSDRVLLQKEF